MEFDGYSIKVLLKNKKMHYYTIYSLMMHFVFLVSKVIDSKIVSKVLKFMKNVVIIRV